MKTRITLILSATVWIIAVGIGLGILLNYETAPGVAATPGAMWPASSKVHRASDRATLVMLAHPKCPCTRASIGELARLMAGQHDKISAYVLFLKPKGVAADWEKTDLWESADAIPGVHVVSDYQGLEARRFQATTSGQTLLFGKDGRLLFSGGITSARGHAGDNLGRSAINSLVNTGKSEQRKTFVFGCSLVDPAAK